MNTLLKFFALILAAAVPAAFGAESLGVAIPTVIDSTHLLGAFVVELTVLTMFADYQGARPLAATSAKTLSLSPRSHYRLAA